jgi:transcriptional regulator with XRE-family HTH domain
MTVGERIAYIRTMKGFSQTELARQAGLSRQCVYEYESGRADPKLLNAMCIADVLGVSLDYLARGETK